MKLPVVLCVALAACGDDGGGGNQADANNVDSPASGGHLVDGTVVPVGGGTAPASSHVIVGWVGDVGQGDYLYKYGEGPATATTFSVDVALPVPTLATFGGEFGVGTVFLIPSSYTVPDGEVTDPAFDTMVLGVAGEYSIIFRANANATQIDWINNFPAGLSCGKCVQQTTGFDTFTPVPCSEMKMQVGPQSAIQGCNWT